MSIFSQLMKNIFLSRRTNQPPEELNCTKAFLNVGGGSKSTPTPTHYSGWRHDLLDIDPNGNPDVLCDARELTKLTRNSYDAVYCSHNLEHYYRHVGLIVVQGFIHVLKEDGFAEILVPNIAEVIRELRDKQLDLDDVLYESTAGPITANDIIYGHQAEIARSGQDFYAHKTGFTPKSLIKLLTGGGFSKVFLSNDDYLGIHALAFKNEPSSEQHTLFENKLGPTTETHRK